MKKVFILCSAMALGLFSSCSDDDSSDSPEDALIGSWQLTAEFENGEAYQLDACDLEETIIFKSGGTYEFIDYDPSQENENECVVDSDGAESGTWSMDSEGKLSITESGDDVETLEYSISGNQLTFISEDEYEGETDVYKTVYVKK
ncbi:hypothetical protein D9O36_11645 [Zobellia amurskyensis]|uniref:Lipocalin-like domain-containing protein n=1 Tax=Zobellia amurskyensis TaxID=248905 RepID=A0A7X2ZU77_9FLAO|nr:lipocalin family protein [Zobellia amurskyensis]MUH36495.1 hypothetical protein [Zobellia amurskyensis]